MKKRNTTYKLNKIDYSIFIICSIGIVIMLYLFYKDMNSFTVRQDEEPIAKIYFKKNTAQRKFVDNDIWEILTSTSDIYDGDKIRTSQNSEAYTKFNNSDVEIQLREKSMIQVFRNKTDKAIEFLSGEMSLSNNSGNDDFVVKTGTKEIKVSKSSEVKVVIPEETKNSASPVIEVEVVQGEIQIADAVSAKTSDTRKTRSKKPEAKDFATVKSGQTVSLKMNEPVATSKPVIASTKKTNKKVETTKKETVKEIQPAEEIPYVESSSIDSVEKNNPMYNPNYSYDGLSVNTSVLKKAQEPSRISSTDTKKETEKNTKVEATKSTAAKVEPAKNVKTEAPKTTKTETTKTASTKVESTKTTTAKTTKADTTKVAATTKTDNSKTATTKTEKKDTAKTETTKISIPDVAGDRKENVPTLADAIKGVAEKVNIPDVAGDRKEDVPTIMDTIKQAAEKINIPDVAGERKENVPTVMDALKGTTGKTEIPDVAGDKKENVPTIMDTIKEAIGKIEIPDVAGDKKENVPTLSDIIKGITKEENETDGEKKITIPDVAGDKSDKVPTIADVFKEMEKSSESVEEGLNVGELISNITLSTIRNSISKEEVTFEYNLYDAKAKKHNHQIVVPTKDVTAENKKIPKGTVLDIEMSGVPDKDEPALAIQISTGEDTWKLAHVFSYTYVNNGAGFKAGVPFSVKKRIVLINDIVNTNKSTISISYDPWHLDEKCTITDFQIKGSVVALDSDSITENVVSGFSKKLKYENISFAKKQSGTRSSDYDYNIEVNSNEIFKSSRSIAEGLTMEVVISGTSDKAISDLHFYIEGYENGSYTLYTSADKNESRVADSIEANVPFKFKKEYLLLRKIEDTDLANLRFTYKPKGSQNPAVLSNAKIKIELLP